MTDYDAIIIGSGAGGLTAVSPGTESPRLCYEACETGLKTLKAALYE